MSEEQEEKPQYYYAIRHKPTGLFFKPNTSMGERSNFSTHGKMYAKKPSFSWLKSRGKINIPLYSTVEEYHFFEENPKPHATTIQQTAEPRFAKDVLNELEIVKFRLVEEDVVESGNEYLKRKKR